MHLPKHERIFISDTLIQVSFNFNFKSSVLQGWAGLKSPGLGLAWEGSGPKKTWAKPWASDQAGPGWAQA